jgi:hypothetical protein
MFDELGSEWLQQRLTARVDDVNGPQPICELREDAFPSVQSGTIFTTAILPDVAVHTARIAPFRQHKENRRRPAEMREPPAGHLAEVVVDALVHALV